MVKVTLIYRRRCAVFILTCADERLCGQSWPQRERDQGEGRKSETRAREIRNRGAREGGTLSQTVADIVLINVKAPLVEFFPLFSTSFLNLTVFFFQNQLPVLSMNAQGLTGQCTLLPLAVVVSAWKCSSEANK